MSPDAQAPGSEYAETVELARERIGPGLRALVLFGSCLSPRTRQASSIPDLFALVDDLDAALVRLGTGRLARWVAPLLPPVTLAFRPPTGTGAPLAKLNLITPGVLASELAALGDLYLAGRLSKRTALVHARDAGCAAEWEALQGAAAAAIAGVVLLGLPRRQPITTAVERCVSISYAAEPRPERPERLRALYQSFAAGYQARFRPLLVAQASARGITVEGGVEDDLLVDGRGEAERAADARALRRLLGRSRRRMMARWPKQALVYRGWLVYLIGKLGRAWRR